MTISYVGLHKPLVVQVVAERSEAQRLPRALFFPTPHPQPFSRKGRREIWLPLSWFTPQVYRAWVGSISEA